MTSYLRITVRFLQPLAHGRKDGGEPEWPPSPLRVFQALVAAAAARWNERMCLDYAAPALGWLERQCRPDIVAAGGTPSENPYRLYVPDNIGDKVAKSWVGGREASIAEYRTEKDVRPTHLSGEAVHYLFPLPADGCPHLEVLKAAARSVTHLGWGVDMVAADADVISEDEAVKLPGHRWRVVPTGGVPLRVPKDGTLANLMEKHAAFLGRLSSDGFKPVPPLSCFEVVGYHSPTVAGLPTPVRPVAAFEIHRTIEDQENPDNSGKSKFRPFHHVRRVATVAGMVRRAAAEVSTRAGMDPQRVERFVQGHGDGRGGQSTSDDRLMYLPVPSLEYRGENGVHVGAVRRILVVGPPGSSAEMNRLRQMLNGEELFDVRSEPPTAMLSFLPVGDKSLTRFLKPATVWTTVTPVMLPGYDDRKGDRRRLQERDPARAPNLEEKMTSLRRLDRRTRELLTQAFLDAGVPPQLVGEAQVEFRSVGYLPGLDLSHAYELPQRDDQPRPRFPRFHVRVTFPHPVSGPLSVGAGRYRGLGLFAAET